MRTAAILPVKHFALAKQRLGESVSESLREDLARAMVCDVLDALHDTPSIEQTIVVTNEQSVALHAEQQGAIVLSDTANDGQSAAVMLGIERALALGIERALCVPGDCPALDPGELAQLLGVVENQPEAVIVPDRHGTGTNGLLLTPADAIAPSFGADSCERHRMLAFSAGITCRVERPSSLLLDIDTGEDLAALRARLSGELVRAPRTRAALGLPVRKQALPHHSPRLIGRCVSGLSARALSGIPEVRPGDDLAKLILASAVEVRDEHVVAIAHKVVSKAEGAVVDLVGVESTARARELAAEQGKDARAVQVVLDQSVEILRAERGVLICRTHHGFVCANAGVDTSNTAAETLVLLPRDPDASARRIRARLRELSGSAPAVLITDSFGRAWRHGQLDVAIGLAGMQPLDDWRGRTDAGGHELKATWLALADAAATTADLARAKDSREPFVLIEGLQRFLTTEDGPGARALLRPLDEDLFR